ncbi:conjugal transfer protein TraM [Salmonella enterica subsp. enterica serovar Telelkebir]|nr:conjugal transfer protein TraM [Salmonella enterica subsp. enterica serovar Telelkebir]ECB6713965.1 conjugal transfer protein TraM [Salmonella enterica subsp. enterica serovar Hvittingfoss]ELT8232567.1 TrbC/VirB2 family protein [Salmonella enterica]
MSATLKKYGPALLLGFMFIVMPELALAGGTDTGESTATSIETWLDTWIPLACTIGIIVSSLLWMLHVLPASWIPRIVFGLVFIGSAAYLVSMTGVGS